MIFATCATIAAILAGPAPADRILLQGDCPGITITKAYDPPVAIEAAGASVAGLTITGSGVIWRGGTIKARGGRYAAAAAGYGVTIRGAARVTIDGATVTDANRGVVVDNSSDVTLRGMTFTGIGQDGIIASSTTGFTVIYNRFANFAPLPSSCNINGVTMLGVASRDCKGVWKDGYHPDAVQIRNAITDAFIAYNVIEGDMQGVGQMEAKTDLPLKRVVLIGNQVRNTMPHSLTLADCIACAMIGNDVQRTDPPGKTVLRFRPDQTVACGNRSASGGAGLEPCR